MPQTYYDGITQAELESVWESFGHEFFATFEDFKKDYIESRKREHQTRADNIERHNWLYSVNG